MTRIWASPRPGHGFSRGSNWKPAASSAAPSPASRRSLSGAAPDLGWGVTSTYLDDQDLLIEQLNPENPDEDTAPPTAGSPARNAPVDHPDQGRGTPYHHAPLVRKRPAPARCAQLGLAEITPPGHVAALSWTALSADDTSMSAVMGIMRATNVQEAIEAGRLHVAPAQNLTLIDQETIAMKVVGALPRRFAGHQSQGRIPSQGWLPENRWDGTLPYSANPEFVSPPGGILGNTNNKIIDRPFPYHVSFDWGDTQRVQRWERLMQGREVHTRDSFVEAQLDTVSITARTLLPLIAAELWFTGEAAPEGTPERRRQRALELLADWNGEMNEHLPEPLIYAAWLRACRTG